MPRNPPRNNQRNGPSWYDEQAGPLVRLYALTRGRARPSPVLLDLLSLVTAEHDPAHDPMLSPEQAAVLTLCRIRPRSVADLAADLDLPLGVTRMILTDLLEYGNIRVTRPVRPTALPDERLLQEVINGLRAL
jgi:Protein of unknown function (DUF742)